MNQGPAPAALRVIRGALLAGIVIFGSVAWYVTQEGPVASVTADATRYLSMVLIGLSAASIGVVLVVRSLRERAEGIERRSTLTVVGWAMGEAPALLGGVIYLMTASAFPYLTGLCVFLLAVFLIPVPEEN